MKFIDLTIEVIDLSRDESESNSESTEEECCICYEVLSQGRTIKLKCGHTYHTKCIKKWAAYPHKRTCPFDRKRISRSELDEIMAQPMFDPVNHPAPVWPRDFGGVWGDINLG